MKHQHKPTSWRSSQYLTHAHSHITRAVAAMDICFALIRVHQHSIAVWPIKRLVQTPFTDLLKGAMSGWKGRKDMDWLIGNTLGNEFVFSLFLEEQDWWTGERTESLTTNNAWVRVLWLVLFSPPPPPREVFLRVFGFPHLPRNMLLPLLIFFSGHTPLSE